MNPGICFKEIHLLVIHLEDIHFEKLYTKIAHSLERGTKQITYNDCKRCIACIKDAATDRFWHNGAKSE